MDVPKPLLERIISLAQQQILLQGEITRLEVELKNKKQEYIKISGGFFVEGLIPAAMAEAHLLEFVLDNGFQITIGDIVQYPSMAKDSPDRPKVLDWAEKNGHEGSIKDTLTVPFKKGDEKVKAVLDLLNSLQIEFDRYRTINAQTLGALFREIENGGGELPLSELNIQKFKQAFITLKKVTKPKSKKQAQP